MPDAPHPADDALILAAARQIEALRRGRTLAPSPLDAGAVAAGRLLERESLPGYELLRELHRGGQGVVYEALQVATKRKVAIKVLADHPAASGAARRRFELEVEILSQLRHPHIVTVHDSGQALGRFFYVMDLVSGVPLDRWIESRRAARGSSAGASTARAGLRAEIDEVTLLFTKICDAVNAAHLRGVIHRDLKPGNILIDGAGEPRVLDFGLAKYSFGMPSDPSSVAPMTQTGQFVGSLPWSSPEQVSSADIDMRSDVYALGVLLYQGLTGQFPYRVVGSAAEVVEQIRSVEPRSMNESRRTTIGGGPGAGEIDGELETIVRLCLQKDRQRRYQTAGDLGRDLARYRSHEPIAAKRDSLVYVLRKHLRRHRLAVGAAGGVLAALALGLAASLFFWRHAELKRQEAQAESQRAKKAEQVANTRREEADAVVTLLEGLFGSSDAYQFPGPDATIRDVVDGYAATLFAGLGDKPEIELRLRGTIGGAYYNLAEFEKSLQQFERGVELARSLHGPTSPRVSEMLNQVGSLRLVLGAADKAEEAFRAALAIDRATRDDPECYEADSLLGLGSTLTEQGRITEAEPVLEQAVEAYGRRPAPRQLGQAEALGRLGKLQLLLDRAERAETLLTQALELAQERYGPADPRTAVARSDLATLFFHTGRPRDAAGLYEAAAAADAKFYGERDPRRATELCNLAIVLKSLGELDRAEAAHREALSIRREKLAPHDPALSLSLEGLATVLEARRLLDEAQTLFDEAAAIREAIGAVDAHYVRNRLSQGRIRYLRQDYDGAAAVYEALLETQRKTLPPDDAGLLVTKQRLGLARLKQGQHAEAERLLRECLAAREAGEPTPSWTTYQISSALGEAVAGQARPDEALPLLTRGVDGLLAAADAPPDAKKDAVRRMVAFAEQQKDDAAAASWRAKLANLP